MHHLRSIISRLGRLLTYVLAAIEWQFDRIRYYAKRRFGYRAPLQIVAYRGYGTATELRLKGRVLKDKGITPGRTEDSVWKNLINMYKRLESDEVPGAQVRACFDGNASEFVANEEGFFELNLQPSAMLREGDLWRRIELELVSPLARYQDRVAREGEVLVPRPSARFAVISDVDDTIIYSNVINKLRMLKIVFFNNARTRLPFKGVAAFYRALHIGASGYAMNPIFYVSNSPWNLYDFLIEIFDIHELPAGPLLLRDIGLSQRLLFSGEKQEQKLAKIRRIIGTYTDLPFILIGDSGEKDPEIYAEIVKQYPDRVMAIYIRNVNPDPARVKAIDLLAEEVHKARSQLILAHDTLVAATHAAEQGWISYEALPEVRDEKEADERQGGKMTRKELSRE